MAQKLDYTTEALDRLLESLKERDKVAALVASFLDRCQELEDAAYPIIEQRDIDQAVGHRLERIGQIVNVDRAGRTDDDYRLRIRAEFAILRSNGTIDDIINVLQLLLGMPTTDILVEQQFPKSLYVRPRNWVVTEDTILLATQLRRAVSAGTELQLITTDTEADDDDLFRYGDAGSELTSSKGFGSGKYVEAS